MAIQEWFDQTSSLYCSLLSRLPTKLIISLLFNKSTIKFAKIDSVEQGALDTHQDKLLFCLGIDRDYSVSCLLFPIRQSR